MDIESAASWAKTEFGRADLSDARRSARLVAFAEGVARQPAGRITEIFDGAAEREAAYRFLRNPRVDCNKIGEASSLATFERAEGLAFVFVPIDGSSLALTDKSGDKDFGFVGTLKSGAPGLIVQTAIGVAPDGTPLGVVSQQFWSRKKRSSSKPKRTAHLPLEEKETRFWNESMERVRQARESAGVSTRLWFQLDRGGDAKEVLFEGLNGDDLFTVRAAYSRRLKSEGDEQLRYLRTSVQDADVVGTYEVAVTSRPGRRKRCAHMVVRTAKVTIQLNTSHGRPWNDVEATALLAREEGTTPDREKPLDWLLITNADVNDMHDAELVLTGYAARWRIEEFHKAWKSGVCKTEDTLLRSAENVERFARITAAAAIRVVRLSYLARNAPTVKAAIELSDIERRALSILAKKRRYVKHTPNHDAITVAQCVEWIARLGGYTGRSSGGPPGFITLQRGLERLEPFVEGLACGMAAS